MSENGKEIKQIEGGIKDSDFGRRLNELINRIGKTKAEVAREIDISYKSLQNYTLGERKPVIVDILARISKEFNVNVDWLLTGEGAIFKDEECKEIKEQMGDFIDVPLMEGSLSAGPGEAPDNRIVTFLAFRRDWLLRFGDPTQMSVIKVSGDSMEPTLFPGDIVLVNHSLNWLDRNGGIYAITLKGDNVVLIKRLQYDYEHKKIKVISDNTRYEPFLISEDDIYINGRVIWFARELVKAY